MGALQRLLYATIRIPLVVVTWLLTQTSTEVVPDLTGLLERTGFEVVARRTALMGSLAAVVARPSRGAN